jgi:hypothetical protein
MFTDNPLFERPKGYVVVQAEDNTPLLDTNRTSGEESSSRKMSITKKLSRKLSIRKPTSSASKSSEDTSTAHAELPEFVFDQPSVSNLEEESGFSQSDTNLLFVKAPSKSALLSSRVSFKAKVCMQGYMQMGGSCCKFLVFCDDVLHCGNCYNVQVM